MQSTNWIHGKPFRKRRKFEIQRAYGVLPVRPPPPPTRTRSPGITLSPETTQINRLLRFGEHIELSHQKASHVFKPLKEWYRRITGPNGLVANGATIDAVEVTDIFMFGPRVGLMRANVSITDRHGTSLPGALFLRGDSVAILVILQSKRWCEDHVMLTCQPRVASGTMTCELPAGMFDDDEDAQNVAKKELFEEVGLANAVLHHLDVVTYPSVGASDERVHFFYTIIDFDSLDMNKQDTLLNESIVRGCSEEGEQITTHIVSLSEAMARASDMKLLAAVALYQQKKQKTISPRTKYAERIAAFSAQPPSSV